MNQTHAGDWNHFYYIPVIPVTIVVIHGGLDEIKSLRRLINSKYHVKVISKECNYEPPYLDNSEKLFLYKN